MTKSASWATVNDAPLHCIQLLALAYRTRDARTAQANQGRGLLAEFGLLLPQGITNVLRRVPQLVDAASGLPIPMRQLVDRLLENMKVLDRQVKDLEAQIKAWRQGSELSSKLRKIPGISPLAASALVASIADARSFKNSGQVAAWLGLVRVSDSKICGVHIAAAHLGNRVDESRFEGSDLSILGTVSGNAVANVAFLSGWQGMGYATMELKGQELQWRINEEKGPHWFPTEATLANSSPCGRFPKAVNMTVSGSRT